MRKQEESEMQTNTAKARTPTARELVAARQAQAPTATSVPAPKASTAVAVPDNRSYRERYLDDVAPASIVGRMIKFSKEGTFVTHDDGAEIDEGAEFTVLADETLIGWIKFNGDGEPPSREMGLLYDGFSMPARESLGDLDTAQWELGLDGQPADPWQHHQYLVLQHTGTAELFTFVTSSKTGRRAVGNLLRHFDRACGRPTLTNCRWCASARAGFSTETIGLALSTRPSLSCAEDSHETALPSLTRQLAPSSTTSCQYDFHVGRQRECWQPFPAGCTPCHNIFAHCPTKTAGRFPELITDDPAAIAAFVKKYDVPGRAVYRCVNPLKPGAHRRNIESVGPVERLCVDLDFKDLVVTPEEIDAKLLQLPLEPTEVRNSGGGRHLVYELNEPIDADDDVYFSRAREVLKRLTAALSGVSCPGTSAALLREGRYIQLKRGDPGWSNTVGKRRWVRSRY